ncbi:MAG: hypothetical protein IPH84_18985 [Bacteroidales bacterium]|nr:hypothetical protein [Bacteroidales bacterium]
MKKVLLVLLFFASLSIKAQEKKEEPKFGISFSGFVKTDMYYDSRQTVNIREGHFLLYPDNIKADLNGKDINEKDQFGILSIQSRLTGKITGPDVLKAKTSALLEADFFGNENAGFADVNGFRLRHAFLKMNWTSTELLVGQYWHPLFVPECFPDVVSFNTGAPFQPFSRNPQIRVSHKIKGFKLILAAAEQRDFTSTGPDGANSKYLRNAVLPDMNLHLQFSHKWNDQSEWMIGVGGEYKSLVPRLFSQVDKNTKLDSVYYVGDEKVTSNAISVYSKLKLKPVTIKVHALTGSNLFDMVMLGGYSVASVTDNAMLKYDYSPVKIMSVWTEIATNGKIQAGIFGGFTKNLGSAKDNIGIYYSRGSNIDYVYRVSPRIIANFEKMRFATELEYTTAQYGKVNTSGVVDTNLQTVTNLRLLLAFYYFF